MLGIISAAMRDKQQHRGTADVICAAVGLKVWELCPQPHHLQGIIGLPRRGCRPSGCISQHTIVRCSNIRHLSFSASDSFKGCPRASITTSMYDRLLAAELETFTLLRLLLGGGKRMDSVSLAAYNIPLGVNTLPYSKTSPKHRHTYRFAAKSSDICNRGTLRWEAQLTTSHAPSWLTSI